jgi:hypothetical protein
MEPEVGWDGWRGPTGLGPPQPDLRPPSSVMLLMSSGTFTLLHVGPWCQFLRGLDRAHCFASFNIFCLGPRSFLPSQLGAWATWSHVHFMS